MRINLYKYPKTMHLPWSPNLQNDDRLIESIDGFKGKRVIALEKMDGENTTMYPFHIHARSLDSVHHYSRDAVKRIWGDIKHLIPNDWRICGENMWAKHSVYYDNLESYFLVFSIWSENFCFSWDDTLIVAEDLGLSSVPVLFDGMWEDVPWDELNSGDVTKTEGYVIRVADGFDVKDFQKYVAKYVRKGHVQTNEHWLRSELIPNKLRV